MARYLIATHQAVLTRDWLCGHCQAYGKVAFQAVGRGRKRVWFSRSSASDTAHERAAAALERDGERIASLVRCPTCRQRARRAVAATAWHGLGDLFTALVAGAIVGALAIRYVHSMALAVTLVFLAMVVALALGDEWRRWRAAARAEIQLSRAPLAQRGSVAAAPTARSSVPDATPFRAPPAPPPIAVVPPTLDMPKATVVHDESAPAPKLLV